MHYWELINKGAIDLSKHKLVNTVRKKKKKLKSLWPDQWSVVVRPSRDKRYADGGNQANGSWNGREDQVGSSGDGAVPQRGMGSEEQ